MAHQWPAHLGFSSPYRAEKAGRGDMSPWMEGNGHALGAGCCGRALSVGNALSPQSPSSKGSSLSVVCLLNFDLKAKFEKM